MEILVILFVISNIQLVFSEDNVATESSVTYQNTYKIHPISKETDFQNDQIAESSHSISHNYESGVGATSLSQVQEGNTNKIQIIAGKSTGADSKHIRHVQNVQHAVQQAAHLPENLRTVELNTVRVLDPALIQGYTHQPQQIFVQQYPFHQNQILDAEASPLQQIQESKDQQALGYSSYVEHLSEKDEKDIKSALKEGSVGDLKRLVPKSGISFKIYKNKKNVNLNLENQNSETHSNVQAHQYPEFQGSYLQNSELGHRIKPELAVTQLKIQTSHEEHQQPPSNLEGSQQIYLKTQTAEPQYELKNSQPLLQPVDATSHPQDQQSVSGQIFYFPQPEVNSQKAFLEVNALDKPLFKINVDDSNYNKATSAVEFDFGNSLPANRSSKNTLNNLQYQKQWSFDSKSEGSQKAVHLKSPQSLQRETNLLTHAQKTNDLHYAQNPVLGAGSPVAQNNFNNYKISDFYAETSKTSANTNYGFNSNGGRVGQNNLARHLASKAYGDKKGAQGVVTRFPGNYRNPEIVKANQNQVISHLGTSAYADSQALQSSRDERLTANSYSSGEAPQSDRLNLISHVSKNSYVETKSGQNNFDHQKALEGSTSFDIKNAIDTTGSLIHQAYVSPTTEIHPLENLQKEQLPYVVPKILTSAVLIDNDIHESPIVESLKAGDFGHSEGSPPLYHTISSPEVSGKFFHHPQTNLWRLEHLKQGNSLTLNDLHQPLIRLHLPKEEIYQRVKAPNAEFATSSISHTSHPQQKQPYLLHYDVPLVKYPQEIYFQPKTKFRTDKNQVGHTKLGQPLVMDWSLFKTMLPNYNVNSLALKPEVAFYLQENGKKIIPVLVRKRKSRSNSKQEIGVVYGKVNNGQRPKNPSHRQEKNVRVNLLPEASNSVKQFETKGVKLPDAVNYNRALVQKSTAVQCDSELTHDQINRKNTFDVHNCAKPGRNDRKVDSKGLPAFHLK